MPAALAASKPPTARSSPRTVVLVLLLSGSGVWSGIGPATGQELPPDIQLFGAEEGEHGPVPTGSTERPHVVVAVVDTGINPFHEGFRRPALTNHPSTYVDGYPAGSQALDVSGPLDWDAVKRERLYWFPRTNIIGGISFGEYSNQPTARVLRDDHGHGTATASNVVFLNPDVKVVMVEMNAVTLSAALAWVAAQAWIDVVSLSLGQTGNVGNLIHFANYGPGHDPSNPTEGAHELPYADDSFWSRTVRAMSEQGKVVVVSSGNEPTPSTTDDMDGPPESISVGGAEEGAHGITFTASKFPDFVSNFTNLGASHTDPWAYVWWDGTSFACPTVAGAISRVVLELRRFYGHSTGIVDGALLDVPERRLTNHDVREALNRTAEYWDATEFDPLGFDPSPIDEPGHVTRWTLMAVGAFGPASVPWLDMGWGYVGEATIGPAFRGLVGTPDPIDLDTQRQKERAGPYMELHYELRARYWSGTRTAITGEATDALPRCGLGPTGRPQCQL